MMMSSPTITVCIVILALAFVAAFFSNDVEAFQVVTQATRSSLISAQSWSLSTRSIARASDRRPLVRGDIVRIAAVSGGGTDEYGNDDDDTYTTTNYIRQLQRQARLRHYRPGSMKAATLEQGRVPYGEESRKFRRTVFTAADWIKHRNSERIISNLRGLFFSGIVRQLREEILLVSIVSAAVVLWNNLHAAGRFSSGGLGMVTTMVALPALPFQLCSQALGLLLVFRTNSSYARWFKARATWARIVSQSRNMVRMAATFADLSTAAHNNDPNANTFQKKKKAITRLALATWLFNRSLMNQLLTSAEDESAYRKEVRTALSVENNNNDDATQQQMQLYHRIMAAPDRTLAAMTEVSLALDRLPIDEKRRVEIDKSIVILGDCLATCEKIYSSPVPLVYTRHTARFLSLWMLLLPAAFYEPFTSAKTAGVFLFKGFSVVVAVAIVAIFFFGIEELAVALEEPFSILPMQAFCDDVKESCDDIINWCLESAELEAERKHSSINSA